MLWIFLALITSFIYSLSAFVDNYTIDVILARRKPQCIKTMNGFVYLIIGVAMLLIFGPANYNPLQIGLLALSGALASLSSIPYYFGLQHEDTTGATIFFQLQPILFLIAEACLFGETIAPIQYLAFFIILSAPAVVVLSRRRKKTRKPELEALIYFTLFVVIGTMSGIIFARTTESVTATSAFAFFLLGRSAFDIISTTIAKSWRHDFSLAWKKDKKRILTFCLTNLLVYLFAEFLYRYCMTIAPQSLVSVMVNAAELILTFILGIILSRIWPKFGREKLTKHVVIAHLVATVLATIGIIILN